MFKFVYTLKISQDFFKRSDNFQPRENTIVPPRVLIFTVIDGNKNVYRCARIPMQEELLKYLNRFASIDSFIYNNTVVKMTSNT